MRWKIEDGFSILLPAADAIGLLGERLKLSHIGEVKQAHRRLRLILNLSAQPDSDTPSVNETTNREAAPESLQFGWAFLCILQAIWEADLVQGPVQVSKLDVTDMYHRSTGKTEQVVHVCDFQFGHPDWTLDQVRLPYCLQDAEEGPTKLQ